MKAELRKLELTPVRLFFDRLVSQCMNLNGQAPILKAREENVNVKRDRDKFQDWLRRGEGRKTNFISTIAKERADIETQSTSKAEDE